MKRVKLIYNPYSGGSRVLQYLDDIFKIYQENGYVMDIFRISYESDYMKLIENIEEYDHYLISGGDGTFNKVMNILYGNNKKIPLGILPLGTANDFSKLLSIPKDVKKACKKIINSKGEKIDLGVVNNDYFINIASLGIFSEVSQGTSILLKKKIGKLAYVVNGIMEVTKGKTFKVKVTSQEFEKIVNIKAILIFNGRTAGNIPLAYNASLKDGYLDVIIIENGNVLNMMDILNNIFHKKHLDKPIENLIYFKSRELLIENVGNEVIKSDIDGEKGPEGTLEIKCLFEGIEILGIN